MASEMRRDKELYFGVRGHICRSIPMNGAEDLNFIRNRTLLNFARLHC